METVSVLVATGSAGASQPGVDDDEEEKEDDNIDIVKVEAITHSTNTSDDYAHRGPKLSSLPLYVYRMYVRRIPRPRREKSISPTIFFLSLIHI